MRAVLAIWIAGALVGVSAASAQPPSHQGDTSRVEIWGAVTLAPAGPTGTVATSYSPPLLFDGDFTSHAGQTLTGEISRHAGVTAGVNVYVSEHAGLQVVFDRRTADLVGTNGPYAFTLNYTSVQPPSTSPAPATVTGSTPWPDTDGSWTDVAFAVNGVVRFGRLDRVFGTISAGPALHRIDAGVEPIAYTTFRLGGHSVLFQDDFRIRMAGDTETRAGFNAGADVNIVLAPAVAIVLGYRLFAGPDAEITVRPSDVLNPNDVGVQQTIEEIAAHFPNATLTVPMNSSRFFAGIRLRLR